MKFAAVEDNLQRLVMSMGLGGLLGSTPGLFVGMGLGKVCNLPFTFTHTEEGKLSKNLKELFETRRLHLQDTG